MTTLTYTVVVFVDELTSAELEAIRVAIENAIPAIKAATGGDFLCAVEGDGAEFEPTYSPPPPALPSPLSPPPSAPPPDSPALCPGVAMVLDQNAGEMRAVPTCPAGAPPRKPSACRPRLRSRPAPTTATARATFPSTSAPSMTMASGLPAAPPFRRAASWVVVKSNGQRDIWFNKHATGGTGYDDQRWRVCYWDEAGLCQPPPPPLPPSLPPCERGYTGPSYGECTSRTTRDPPVTESTFDAAVAAVLAHSNCHGITYEPHTKAGGNPGKFTGRVQTASQTSPHHEISWVMHDESGDADNCYKPPSAPPPLTNCLFHMGFYLVTAEASARTVAGLCPPGDELDEDDCREFHNWWYANEMWNTYGGPQAKTNLAGPGYDISVTENNAYLPAACSIYCTSFECVGGITSYESGDTTGGEAGMITTASASYETQWRAPRSACRDHSCPAATSPPPPSLPPPSAPPPSLPPPSAPPPEVCTTTAIVAPLSSTTVCADIPNARAATIDEPSLCCPNGRKQQQRRRRRQLSARHKRPQWPSDDSLHKPAGGMRLLL